MGLGVHNATVFVRFEFYRRGMDVRGDEAAYSRYKKTRQGKCTTDHGHTLLAMLVINDLMSSWVGQLF
mgnify:CR=1 FL=1